MEDGSLIGSYRSGNHYKIYWTAKPTETALMPDPYSMTAPSDSSAVVDFTFKDINGREVSLSDPEFEGKPKIIQLMGTWCPNCRDETEFLMDYRKKHPDKKFATIALAFEKHKDPELARAAISKYINHYGIEYDVLYVGSNDKSEASTKLPFLKKVISFPTMIFLDKNNRIVAIHTGFNGPATDKYEDFQTEFDILIDSLLNDK